MIRKVLVRLLEKVCSHWLRAISLIGLGLSS